MRAALVFISILTTIALSAQDLPSIKDGEFQLTETVSDPIGLACGFAGTPSNCVVQMRKWVVADELEKVIGTLFSLKGEEAYLAALAIGPVLGVEDELTSAEKTRLELILNGSVSFNTCSGCICCESHTALTIPRAFETRLKAFLSN